MIRIKLDPRQFIKDLDDAGKRQVPFAMMKAINETLTDVQKAERGDIASRFTLRRAPFVLNTVKIPRGGFATKGNLRGIVQIDPDRDQLMKFEDGGDKESRAGKSVAIPVDARRNKADIVPASARPKAYQLTTLAARGGVTVAKGLKRTFLLQRADGTGGLFQRVGKGKNATVRELFAFKRKVKIPRLLTFEQTARSTAAERWPIHIKEWLERALKTAR